MGRFGNQVFPLYRCSPEKLKAAYLLGVMHVARDLNRTLVVPPFIEYQGASTAFQPFSSVFDIRSCLVSNLSSTAVDRAKHGKPDTYSVLSTFHRAISMEQFMQDLAPTVWPPHARRVYCLSADPMRPSCRAKQGSPSRPFWDHFGIDFIGDVGVPLDVLSPTQNLLPPAYHPVVAFHGAPASYPAQPVHLPAQTYLTWTPALTERVALFAESLPRPIVALHARTGLDWQAACAMGQDRSRFLDSAQCLGDAPVHQVGRRPGVCGGCNADAVTCPAVIY